MASLIHLNGPPGIGKSSLAQLYADEHPGVLNLDIDQVRFLIGGWRERFGESGELARPIALSMARTHLGAGHDVIMPQYLGRVTEIERFEAAALDSGAAFREVMLMDGRQESVERFYRRGQDQDEPWHDYVRNLVEAQGGRAMLAEGYDNLQAVLEQRPGYLRVPSAHGAIQETYGALLGALEDTR